MKPYLYLIDSFDAVASHDESQRSGLTTKSAVTIEGLNCLKHVFGQRFARRSKKVGEYVAKIRAIQWPGRLCMANDLFLGDSSFSVMYMAGIRKTIDPRTHMSAPAAA